MKIQSVSFHKDGTIASVTFESGVDAIEASKFIRDYNENLFKLPETVIHNYGVNVDTLPVDIGKAVNDALRGFRVNR